MTERRHYRNAPIIEATISIGIVPSVVLLPEDFISIGELIEDQYPQIREEHLYTGEVPANDLMWKADSNEAHEHIGYAFRSDDGKRILSATLDGFAFSVGPPYGRWEDFRDEARPLWEMFRNVSKVTEIARVALRYINRIDVPSATGSVKLDKYLEIYPEVPDEWPTGLSIHNFFMQVQAWQEDLDCNVIVNQAPARPPSTGIVSVRLDFDLFRERYELPWRIEEEKEVWGYLEKLHDRKNELFETSITDATRRLIS